LIVASVPQFRSGTPVSLLLYLSHPLLGKPGFPSVIENVCIGTTGLVGIAYIPLTVPEDKIVGFGHLKSMVQLFAEDLIAVHQFGKHRNGMRNRPGGLPGMRLYPSRSGKRVIMHEGPFFVSGKDQVLLLIEQFLPAHGTLGKEAGILSTARFLRPF